MLKTGKQLKLLFVGHKHRNISDINQNYYIANDTIKNNCNP